MKRFLIGVTVVVIVGLAFIALAALLYIRDNRPGGIDVFHLYNKI